jgi:hypothetical protein
MQTFQENIMSALRKNEIFETEANSSEAAVAKKTWEPVLYNIVRRPREENSVSVEAKSAASTAKNIALFLASPFIGLAYIAAMPFVALGALAYFGAKAFFNKVPAAKHVAMLAAAPVLGLAMILVAPIVGAGALGYYGSKALARN